MKKKTDGINFTMTDSLKFLWPYLKPFRWNYFVLYVTNIISMLARSILPLLFSLLIDEVIYYKNLAFFYKIGLIYIAIVLFAAFMNTAFSGVRSYINAMYTHVMKLNMLKGVLSAKASYLSSIKTGDILQVINADIYSCQAIVLTSIFGYINNIIQVAIYLTILAFYNYKFALLMVVLIPLSYFITEHYSKKIKTQSGASIGAQTDYTSWLFELLKGLRDIKLMSAEKSATINLLQHLQKIIAIRVKTAVISLKATNIISFVKLAVNLSMYTLAGFLAFRGEITLGMFIAILQYFNNSSNALQAIISIKMDMQPRIIAVKRIHDLVNLENENDDPDRVRELIIERGDIDFKNVSFNYKDRASVLDDVTLDIKSGEHISLAGASGAGKTTLTSLLLGFYKPLTGNILIDGEDIGKCTLRSIRNNIGIVQQDVLIFDGTLGMNLRLGNIHASDEEIMAACDKAAIGDFIRSLPDGLNTVIGKEGIDFSGGQKQRITIARIYLKNPKILIFDEATSALDYESEKQIHMAWDSLMEAKTTITIAHRLSTILKSDKVAVLNDGKIVSFGHHSDLLETCPYYNKLFREQYVTKESEACTNG